MANHCTQFEVSSFSRSGERPVLGGTKNLNKSHDYNHAFERDGLSSLGWNYL